MIFLSFLDADKKMRFILNVVVLGAKSCLR